MGRDGESEIREKRGKTAEGCKKDEGRKDRKMKDKRKEEEK